MGKPLVVRCSSCLAILEEPGALLFTPPDEVGTCTKIHWCPKCYRRICFPELAPLPPSVKGTPDVDADCG